MYTNSVTLEDIVRLALPGGTQILVGGSLLNRPVSWACSLRPSPPAFPKLDGDELALIDMEDLRRLDPKMRLDRVVHSLFSARVAAIAVVGEVNQAAIQAARQNQFVLLKLPETESIVRIERDVIRFIVDRAGYIAQRSAELQHVLNQTALDGGGIEEIAHHIHQFAQQPLVFLRENGQMAASAGLHHLSKHHQNSLFSDLPNVTVLRSWAATQTNTDLSKAIGILTIPTPAGVSIQNDTLTRYHEIAVAPIVANDSIRGYSILLRIGNDVNKEITAVEEIALTQGAASAALEWAKQNAVGLAEERMQAAFVDELLAAEIADEQAWIQRGASLGYELTRPHVAWMIQAKNVPNWPKPLLRFIEEQGVNAPYGFRDEGLLLFWPIDNPKSGRELKIVAGDFVEKVQKTSSKAEIFIGIGRPSVGPSHWLRSQQQARESWRLAQEWKGSPVTYFGDLDFYQLLTALGGSLEANRFFRKTLGRLIEHDVNHKSALVDTLETFFVCHTNLSQTASRLHIHRNTLTYRLERISAITQLDLNDPDARFSLQLALKLRPVMK